MNGKPSHRPWTIILLILGLFLPVLSQNQETLEENHYPSVRIPEDKADHVKALLIGKIPRHIEWPESSGMSDKNKPFIIGSFQEAPFSGWLKKSYENRSRILGKKVELRHLRSKSDILSCHMLLITGLDIPDFSDILKTIQNKPVFTISDSGGLTLRGVHLIIKDRKIENRTNYILDIDISAMKAAGLSARNSLLKSDRVRIIKSNGNQGGLLNQEVITSSFIRKIAQFTAWPADYLDDNKKKPFTIGVISSESWINTLTSLYENIKIKDRAVNIIEVTTPEEMLNCHVLFISSIYEWKIPEILPVLKGQPILTIVNSKRLVREGIQVGLYIQNNKIAFALNQYMIAQARLEMDYRLFRMASMVINRENKPQ